jgi:hypothetical protein
VGILQNKTVCGLLLGVTSAMLSGCTKSVVKEDSQKSTVAIQAGLTPNAEQKVQLLAAKDLLFKKLSARLMEAMSNGGPASAIEVCSQEAQQIAADVGRESSTRIGRIGVRLRNSKNTPPPWAVKLVDDKIGEPQFVVLDNQIAAALLPIKLQPQCLMCHGPVNQIGDDVKQKLSVLYPNDEATGFQDGELRGWFWVELLETKP